MTHGAPSSADAGEPDPPFSHTPVLLDEVLRCLQPGPGQTVVDATLGAGGHAAAVIAALGSGGRLVGIDRDPSALRAAAERLRPLADGVGARLDLVRANYADLAETLEGLGLAGVDAVLFDLGVSSPQFDDPARGFTYRADAELDMRMDPDQSLTAYHLVNGLAEDELAGIIRRYGEERWAARIAAFIVRRREQRGMIATTGELVDVILAAVPAAARRGGPHPARRTFQALRIAVNDELDAVEAGLRAAVSRLRPGGRVVAISFHSLEDRIVKHVFRELSRGCTCPPDWPVCRCGHVPVLDVVLSHPVQPGPDEALRNPRARSAKLRAAVRLAAEGPTAATRGRPVPVLAASAPDTAWTAPLPGAAVPGDAGATAAPAAERKRRRREGSGPTDGPGPAGDAPRGGGRTADGPRPGPAVPPSGSGRAPGGQAPGRAGAAPRDPVSGTVRLRATGMRSRAALGRPPQRDGGRFA